MSSFPATFIAFSIREMETRPDTIQLWAKQDENQLLKTLAREVIQAAGAQA